MISKSHIAVRSDARMKTQRGQRRAAACSKDLHNGDWNHIVPSGHLQGGDAVRAACVATTTPPLTCTNLMQLTHTMAQPALLCAPLCPDVLLPCVRQN